MVPDWKDSLEQRRTRRDPKPAFDRDPYRRRSVVEGIALERPFIVPETKTAEERVPLSSRPPFGSPLQPLAVHGGSLRGAVR